MDPKTEKAPRGYRKGSDDEPLDEEEEIQEIQETRNFVGVNEVAATSGRFNKEDVEYLQSNSTWEALDLEPALAERLVQMGYKRPSAIQSKVIKLTKNNSIVAQAQNGAGKTLAFLVPVLRELLKPRPAAPQGSLPAPQILILADTKALILQIYKILSRLTDGFISVNIDYAFGGKTAVDKEARVLISTVMQVKFAVTKKQMDFNAIDLIVVDEADHVFDTDQGKSFFQPFVHRLLNSPNFRLIFTSATMTQDFRQIVQGIQEKRNILSVEMPVEELTLKNVQQYMITYTSNIQKLQILELLISKIQAQNILIFDNTKRNLFALKEFLTDKDYKTAFIYKADGEANNNAGTADFIQQQIDDFLAGKYRILLTTNLLSRGIDMRKVTLVINFSLPFKFKDHETRGEKEVDLETYLHRVGRTGRFGDRGIALNFVNAKYETHMVDTIKEYYKNEIERIDADDLGNLNQKLLEIQGLNQEKRDYLEEDI